MTTNTSIRNGNPPVGATSMPFDFDIPACETIESALAACGWVASRNGNSFTLGAGRDAATLTELPETSGWRHFAVRQRKFQKTSDERVLSGNFKLLGPMKLVAENPAPVCRLDVPTEFVETAATEILSLNSLAAMNPTFFWASAVTTALSGQSTSKRLNSKPDDYESTAERKLETPLPVNEIAAQLQASGWTATAEEGRVYVNVSLPGIFRQVEIASDIDDDGRQHVVLGCTLIQVPGEEFDLRSGRKGEGESNSSTAIIESSDSTRAIVHLAQHVNSRLPLARMALDTGSRPWRLRSEVSFCDGPIPGAWLTTALDAVQSAIAATALEFEALRRDAELATLVLAASAD